MEFHILFHVHPPPLLPDTGQAAINYSLYWRRRGEALKDIDCAPWLLYELLDSVNEMDGWSPIWNTLTSPSLGRVPHQVVSLCHIFLVSRHVASTHHASLPFLFSARTLIKSMLNQFAIEFSLSVCAVRINKFITHAHL